MQGYRHTCQPWQTAQNACASGLQCQQHSNNCEVRLCAHQGCHRVQAADILIDEGTKATCARIISRQMMAGAEDHGAAMQLREVRLQPTHL